MRYTLAQNAISSLSIAIDYYKKWELPTDDIQESIVDENLKICVVFLHNAVELMLKTIMVSKNPRSIYKEPECKRIVNAQSRLMEGEKLEDILLLEGKIQTIKYIDLIKIYCKEMSLPDKVKGILKVIETKRNAITHFGLDDTYDEIDICLIKTFLVIYQYLYSELVNLDEIGEYFTSDDLYVSTVHGIKPLLDENQMYNNIIDFLDELAELSERVVPAMYSNDQDSSMYECMGILKSAIIDDKINKLQDRYSAKIDFTTCDYQEGYFSFDVIYKNMVESIYSIYSVIYDVIIFCNEINEVYFILDHNSQTIYMYDDLVLIWKGYDEPEPDEVWIKNVENGRCTKLKLSKRNVLFVFENILKHIIDEDGIKHE